MRVEEAASGTAVRLRVDETVEVALAERPTAGFRWRLASDGAPACRLEGDRFVPPSGPAGATGSHSWTFKAVLAGTGTVALGYGRSFGQAQPVRSFTLRVTVE